MADILLLEPNYSNKYPPLGLMKLSFYHKKYRNDNVRFAKGKLPDGFPIIKWDRIYVASLFTFEWNETKKSIEYAMSLAKAADCIFVGGILASLMPDLIMNNFPKINVIMGQLNVKGKIGYDDDDIIDTLTPDYSMLDDIRTTYVYPTENAYFMYMTRGCGMKCGFCAVQTLEPRYVPYISIKEQVKTINELFGEKKDLLLMDNNVLISPRFDDIVDEIKEIGFAKGAMYRNPVSGKMVKRYIDFNQGLDAFKLSEMKAKKLAEIEISPARIAFDHIEDAEIYTNAIRRCAKYGIRELSNYILYNSETFKGKGSIYKADTPQDLYTRMRITIDLKDEINQDLPSEKQISIFSFPMRYIPLDATKRGYVGSSWNIKYLRAIQAMLIPTQGKGVSNRSFFEADFGSSLEEYMETLAMPEDIITSRGIPTRKTAESIQEFNIRLKKAHENEGVRNEWKRLFRSLGNKKEKFLKIIATSEFNVDKNHELYMSINDEHIFYLLLHYLNVYQLLKLMKHIGDRQLILINRYCTETFPLLLDRVAEYVYKGGNTNYAVMSNFVKVFGKNGLRHVLQYWINDNFCKDGFIDYVAKLQLKAGVSLINVELLQIFISFKSLECFDDNDIINASRYIVSFNDDAVVQLLSQKKDDYVRKLKDLNSQDVGTGIILEQIDILTAELFGSIGIY